MKSARDYLILSWSELTELEQQEARERGFPSRAKFHVKKNYREGQDYALIRWSMKP